MEKYNKVKIYEKALWMLIDKVAEKIDLEQVFGDGETETSIVTNIVKQAKEDYKKECNRTPYHALDLPQFPKNFPIPETMTPEEKGVVSWLMNDRDWEYKNAKEELGENFNEKEFSLELCVNFAETLEIEDLVDEIYNWLNRYDDLEDFDERVYKDAIENIRCFYRNMFYALKYKPTDRFEDCFNK